MKDFRIDFVVVGAARCGTTTLYNYLVQHPQLYLPRIKELNYFSKVESKDLVDYKNPKKDIHYHTKIIKSFDVYKNLFENAVDSQLKGDISPSYLWKNDTAQRIYDHNPDAKILISLRNPVQRAFSHYAMNYGVGYEKNETFERALKAKREKIWGGGNQYLELSSYFEPIKSYYQLFDKKNIHLMIFEDWILDKDHALKDIFKFLNVDEEFSLDNEVNMNKRVSYKNLKMLNFFRNRSVKNLIEKVVNVKTKEKIKAKIFKKEDFKIKMEPILQEELKVYFKDDVRKLEDLLEIPLMEKWQMD